MPDASDPGDRHSCRIFSMTVAGGYISHIRRHVRWRSRTTHKVLAMQLRYGDSVQEHLSVQAGAGKIRHP
jgi:hypothetical protein